MEINDEAYKHDHRIIRMPNCEDFFSDFKIFLNRFLFCHEAVFSKFTQNITKIIYKLLFIMINDANSIFSPELANSMVLEIAQ